VVQFNIGIRYIYKNKITEDFIQFEPVINITEWDLGPGAHPASYTMGTGGSFPGGKARQRRDADHSFHFSAEAKKE
jgi:hypothetical protein